MPREGVVLAKLTALALALPASGDPLATLEAHLTGEKEVPGPGDPNIPTLTGP